MMTVPMNNSVPTSRELVQRLLNKNIELENRRRESAQARIPSDPNAWQQMRENYESIILEDHVFSEQHGIEHALWHLHYRRIEELRAHFSAALASPGSTKSPGGKVLVQIDRIKKIRSQFKTFLSEASGFYHELILKIRAKYGLPLGYEDQENQSTVANGQNKSIEMKKALVSCHRCLIYLGDLARYKGLYGEGDSRSHEYAAASSYYSQATLLLPSSGNPHHQLGILASYSGDELLAVYRYFRSLAVESPFSTAKDNLLIAFEKNRQSYSQILGKVRVSSVKTTPAQVTETVRGKGEKMEPSKDTIVETTSSKEIAINITETYKAFCGQFVRLNGILFTRTSLETIGEVFSLVCGNLHELLSSGVEEKFNLGPNFAENGLVIVRLIAILIFMVHNAKKETEGLSYAEILQRSVLIQNAYSVAFEIVGRIFERCSQLNDPSSSYLLPGILVFVEWLACRMDIAAGSDVEEKQTTSRSMFWKRFLSLLNKLLLTGPVTSNEDADSACFFNMSRYEEGNSGNRLALWEDFELRGFLPVVPAQLILDFSRKSSTGSDGSHEKRVRVNRILAAGKVLVNVVQIDHQAIYYDRKLKKFAIGVEPETPDELILASPAAPKSNGSMQENPLEKNKSEFVLQNLNLQMEGEDEDEEIVFKPTISEKFVNVVASNLISDKANGQPPSAHVSIAQSSSQTINQSVALKQHLNQTGFFADEIKNSTVVDRELALKAMLEEVLTIQQPPVVSCSFPQNVNNIHGGISPDQIKVPETVVQSKFDMVMTSGAKVENLPVRSAAVLPASLRKSPVSRPVRHSGPPPGFSLPPKLVEEPVIGPDLRNGMPVVDDYRWLDGYQLPSSTNAILPNISVNGTGHIFPHAINNINSSMGPTNFPFPGKQVPSQVVNQKTWQDYQHLEHLKLYQQNQNLIQRPNQEFIPPPEQYQGHPQWPGRFG